MMRVKYIMNGTAFSVLDWGILSNFKKKIFLYY